MDPPEEGHEGTWSLVGPWRCNDDCPHPKCVVERALAGANDILVEGWSYGEGGGAPYATLDADMAARTAVEALSKTGWLRKRPRDVRH